MSTQNVDNVLEKTYMFVVRVVNFKENKPIKNVNVKVFRLEMEPITPKQWAENLKNGTPFKKLILAMNTNDNVWYLLNLQRVLMKWKSKNTV